MILPRVRRGLFLAIAIASVALVLMQSQFLAAAGIEAPASVECGRVARNQLREFQVNLKNTDSASAQILEVVSSCACTDVALDGGETIGPQETRGVRGRIAFGRQIGRWQVNLHIKVKDSLGGPRVIAIPLRAEVVAPVVLEREHLDFGDVMTAGSKMTQIVSVARGNSEIAFDALSTTSSSEYLESRVERRNDGGFDVAVTFDPKKAPAGFLRTSVRLGLMHKGKELGLEETLKVTGRVRGSLEAKPASFYVGALNSGEETDRAIMITSPSGLDMRKITVEPKIRGLTIKRIGKSIDRVSLLVGFVGTAPLGPVKGHLLVKHPEARSDLTVPLIGLVKNGEGNTGANSDGIK